MFHVVLVTLMVIVVLLVGAEPSAGAPAASDNSVRALSLPYPPEPSVAVHPPGAAFWSIKRDCGFSAPLSDGSALWVFCDTSDVNAAGEFSYFVNNTAAYGSAAAPTAMLEKPAALGKPYQFITTPGYNPCYGYFAGQEHVIWPTSATTVREGGLDRVIIFFQNLCYNSAVGGLTSYTVMSVGVAEWWHAPGDPDLTDRPIQAKTIAPVLFPAMWDGRGEWGEAAVLAEDGSIYIYRCAVFWGCQIGRVPPWDVSNALAYRWWNSFAWVDVVPSPPQVTLVGGSEPAAGYSVVWLEDMGLYGMGYSAFPGGFVNDVDLRVSPQPAGPWSAPVATINADDCSSAVGCYAGYIHAQLSGIDHVGLSQFDPDRWYPGGGQTRALQTRVDVAPAPPGVCYSGFRDVWSAQPFCGEIKWFGDIGYTSGFADGTFRPAMVVTRQAMAAWFYRLAGRPTGPFPDPGFADVAPGDPFYDEIAWFVDAGFALGFGDGSFRPTSGVTRQAVAAWFYRYEGSPPGPFPNPGFSDVAPSHPLYDEIAWLATTGITTGYPDGSFRPATPVTRDASAAYFQRHDALP